MKLGDFVTLQRGHDLPERDRLPGPVPVLGSFGITGYHNNAIAPGPGVTVGRSGASYGVVSYSPVDYWPLNTALYVINFHGNDPRFAYYFLRNFDFSGFNVGSAQPSLNRNHIHPIPVLIPSVSEQKTIARILGTLDDKIELNRRMNQTLEGLARTVFRSWFVDFDAVVAKAAGRRPLGMDAATAELFPDSFTDSPLGPIPKGWRIVSLPEAIEINPTRTLSKDAIAPYVEMGNMPTTSARVLGWEDRKVGSGMRFMNGDVLMARITPCLENGKTAYVDFLGDGHVGWGSTEYIVLKSKPPLPPEFAYLLARLDEVRAHAIANMTGSSGRQRVPASCFEKFQVVVPGDKVARRFGEWVKPLFDAMKSHDEQSRTLADLRDALLPRLLSGELRVKQAKRAVESVV
jgi:type I restriction enzyme S subunit